MKEQHTDSVQNRFTAYLVASVTNQRIRYIQKRRRLKEQEALQTDLLEKNYLDFETQLHSYISEREAAVSMDWKQYQEIMDLMESRRLMKAVGRLKEREKTLLFARVFGDLTFAELGEILQMNPKQAEMAYYYVVRKIRKELEARRDEF